VIGLTDMAGRLVERYVYTPYGELTVHQHTSFGDRDGDYDVDSTDKGTVGSTCTGTVSGSCRILDLDFDGDYDSTDATKFDALTQGWARHPGLTSTGVQQPFAHQGLLFEPEIGSYQNRARQYDPAKRRFAQRDRLPGTALIPLRKSYRDRLHLYAYVRACPICMFDPTGMYALLLCDGYQGGGEWFMHTGCCYATDGCFNHLCNVSPAGCDSVQMCGEGHVACPPAYQNWPDYSEPLNPNDSFCHSMCLAIGGTVPISPECACDHACLDDFCYNYCG
jgi:RHS repeat-associated protein